MIDQVHGSVYQVYEKAVGILVQGLGLHIQTPRGNEIQINEKITLHTYMHWNAENGPSLLGFSSIFERTIFLLIIECPKIGPSIGLSILSQIKPSQFLEIVASQNEKALSSINGIGPKKAEQIIVSLKHKVTKLIQTGDLPLNMGDDFASWQQASEVLHSLNYSKQEIQRVLQQLNKKYSGQQVELGLLIRNALSLLSSVSLDKA